MNLRLWQQQLQKELDIKHVEFNIPMSEHTYFKIGGLADAFIVLNSETELKKIKKWSLEQGIPLTLVGNGTNLLVSDKGIRGIVVKIESKMSSIEVNNNRLSAQAGALLSQVAQVALEHSLTGLEFASGIPGSIGGAVFMNAGAYDREMKDVVSKARVVTKNGIVEEWDKERLKLGYRTSAVENENAVITNVVLSLKKGSKEEIEAEMNKLNRWRRERQPLSMPSAGSTFKRPPKIAGSYLIDQAGLKGYAIGGAQVSEKHAGFIVNTGGATAQNVLDLMACVQKIIYEKYNLLLQPEVRILGEKMESDLIIKQ